MFLSRRFSKIYSFSSMWSSLNRVIWLLIVGVVCLFLEITIIKFIPSFQTSLHPITNFEKIHMVDNELNQFVAALKAYCSSNNSLPGSTLSEAIGELRADPKLSILVTHYLDSGLDPWSHPFRYHFDPITRELRVYSCGPNGIDDGGHEDDILELSQIPK